MVFIFLRSNMTYKLCMYCRSLLKWIIVMFIWIMFLQYFHKYLHPNVTDQDILRENKKRLQEAQIYLERQSNVYMPASKVLIAIVSVTRKNGGSLNYVTQTIGKFMQLLHEDKSKDYSLFLCNASGLTNDFSPIEKKIGVENVFKYESKHISTILEKELLDYIACLNEIDHKFPNIEFLLLNEDDGVPYDDFLSNIKQITDMLIRKTDISHVKLYHPLRLRKIPAIIYAVTFPLTVIGLWHWIYPGSKHHYLCFMIFVISFLFVCGANEVGILHTKLLFGYLTLVMPESCCTVSVLYPKKTLNATIKYLQKHKHSSKPKDTILDNLPDDTNMRVLMTEFNMVKHIGKYSTLSLTPLSSDAID